MVKVEKLGVILSKTEHDFENEGVLNPAVIADGGAIHMIYRALHRGNHSTLGYCRLSSPTTVEFRRDSPLLYPEDSWDCQGVEDARIVKIDGVYYLSYTSYDGYCALGSLALSTDLEHFEKKGIIVPTVSYKDFREWVPQSGKVSSKYYRFDQCSITLWDKNVIFFPRRINGKLAFMHRIRPGIQIAYVDSIEELTEDFWHRYFLNFKQHILIDPKEAHETSYIGGGCPPIETEAGWLLIYHSVRDTIEGFIYVASAALMDIENPQKELARLPYPLFFPEEDWELVGEVDNVCFPTGSVLQGDDLYIYYGAADARIAVARISLSELLRELNNHKTRN
jgi:predicted GH43/DUF377 family glycosyl hydrolase